MDAAKQKRKSLLHLYLITMKNNQILPNFWMSEEYIEKSNMKAIQETVQGFKEPEEDRWFFPPLNSEGRLLLSEPYYAGFPKKEPLEGEQFLDYQFVYDPEDFLTMEGKRWGVFRKNIRKYPRRNPGTLAYQEIGATHEQAVETLLLAWTEGKELYDPDVLVLYAFQGENRWGLFLNGKLVGLNIWDENDTYVNYRYCIDYGTPFLQEHLRWRFYTHSVIQEKKKLVNDGGSLGSQALHKFKLKLNPVAVYKIHSNN